MLSHLKNRVYIPAENGQIHAVIPPNTLMILKIKQNKIRNYLAVTAGVGCASSVANAALVVVDLSGVSIGGGTLTIGGAGSDASVDIMDINVNAGSYGMIRRINGYSVIYSDAPAGGPFTDGNGGMYASGATVAFPTDADVYTFWNKFGTTRGAIGLNWVAFKDSQSRFGWLGFTLNSLGVNTTNPVTRFDYFIYDTAATSPATSPGLQTALAAIPEPSSLALLALGATGLLARRRRRQAA